MFRYLWSRKPLSIGLIAAFIISLSFHPTSAWSGLGILIFLRLTKIHSCLLMLDLTDRAAKKHVRILATKRAHLMSPDE